MPREVLAGNGRRIARATVTDSKMQRHHTVATARVREGVG